ncbi:hypothetical protein XA68_11665 [Ophiocordyceps unilateralis]|uniref:Uncharacterized protein n=1 Tax=Ophiocordyceps unilateralis TaxID=268505 RepID=A0A2A9PGJ2_OPHUN|nr:hypothetical protein XA68_11665 [Ophiocordyceps unilateralis]
MVGDGRLSASSWDGVEPLHESVCVDDAFEGGQVYARLTDAAAAAASSEKSESKPPDREAWPWKEDGWLDGAGLWREEAYGHEDNRLQACN